MKRELTERSREVEKDRERVGERHLGPEDG